MRVMCMDAGSAEQRSTGIPGKSDFNIAKGTTMLVRLILATAVALAVGCSSSSNDDTTPSGTDAGAGGTDTGTDTGMVAAPITGDPSSAPTTGIDAVWLGATSFGESVFVIDAQQNIFGFSSNGAGQYQSTFGNLQSGEVLRQFSHRDSEDASIGTGFTVSGDVVPGAETVSYTFSLSADGQLLNNTGAAGDFSLMRAALSDMPELAIADIAGDWEARVGLCGTPDTCNSLVVELTIGADGSMSGAQKFGLPADVDAGAGAAISGTVQAVGQYLTTSFTWAIADPVLERSGVIYRDRTDPERLVLNAFGLNPDDTEKPIQTFSALLSRK
jgi:hypothetical protein